ncbi:MAG: hypothetical protein ABI186_01240 [Candidatus Elarobacter sp.]
MDGSNAPYDAYPAGADGMLTSEGLRQACGHVWRDSNSNTMLGADVLNSEPVSFDDKSALAALRRHISVAGPSAFIQDVLPNLGFGPIRD